MEHRRYVILRHEGVAVPHFDLMFEQSATSELLTWRSLDWPISDQTKLTRLGDHRRKYLDYEGPVSNNYGHVKRVAAGTCEMNWPNRCECHVQLDDAPE